MPTSLIHNRAPGFLADVLQDTAFILDIKQLPTTPGHPQYDGLIKRFSRTLKAMLAKVVTNKGRDWDKLLAYRTMVHSSTGKTSFFLLHIW